MSDNVFTGAGSKVFVCADMPYTEDAAGYGVLSWTQVKGVSSVPDFDDSSSVVTHPDLDDQYTKKAVGMRNGGSGPLDMRRITGDPGQAILDAARESKCNISLKIQYDDIPCNGGTTPTIEYRKVIVTSRKPTGLGGPDNIMAISYNIEVNSKTVTVAAA